MKKLIEVRELEQCRKCLYYPIHESNGTLFTCWRCKDYMCYKCEKGHVVCEYCDDCTDGGVKISCDDCNKEHKNNYCDECIDKYVEEIMYREYEECESTNSQY